MKCVVVNDASCLIDLRKGGLLAEQRIRVAVRWILAEIRCLPGPLDPS